MRPIQPIKDGRFVENKIVNYLLEHGGISMNDLAVIDFSQEDREQFAQLIGYSVAGYAMLGYVSNESFETASRLEENPKESELEARNAVLRETLTEIRGAIKTAATALFQIHEDDLQE